MDDRINTRDTTIDVFKIMTNHINDCRLLRMKTSNTYWRIGRKSTGRESENKTLMGEAVT